jgi:hypothetical protein
VKSFKQYITEASSVEDEALGHLTHVKDIAHEEPRFGGLSHELLTKFHQHRMGKTPEGFGASLKHDGGASVIVGHDEKGISVTDKHRAARGVVARTPEDIQKHFGHAPGYAAGLTHLLQHGHELVPKGKKVQGDLLFTPGDGTSHTKGQHTRYTPNRIDYEAKTKAPIGLAVHTEVKKGVAQSLSKGAIKKTPNIFVPHHDYSKPDPSTYSAEDRAATEHHLAKAKELLHNHTTEHLTPEHIQHFTIYNNRTTRSGTAPTTSGYIKHLEGERDKAAGKLKTEAGKQRVKAKFGSLIQHVYNYAPHFDRSIAIRHHLEQASEHLLKGISHPDLKTRIDGKKSAGEGVVLSQKDAKGRMRPVGKIVPKAVSKALLNNPRFGRGELTESIVRIMRKRSENISTHRGIA